MDDLRPELQHLTRSMQMIRSDVDSLRSSGLQASAHHKPGSMTPGAAAQASQQGVAGQVAQLYVDLRNLREDVLGQGTDAAELTRRVRGLENAFEATEAKKSGEAEWRASKEEQDRKHGEKLTLEMDRMEAALSTMDLARSTTEGRILEIQGYMKSIDRDISQNRTEAHKLHQEADERSSAAVLEMRTALQEALLSLRGEIKATCQSLEEKTTKSIELAQTLALKETKGSHDKGSKAISELNRVMRGIEQKLGAGFREEQQRLKQSFDQTWRQHAEAAKTLVEKMDKGLREAMTKEVAQGQAALDATRKESAERFGRLQAHSEQLARALDERHAQSTAQLEEQKRGLEEQLALAESRAAERTESRARFYAEQVATKGEEKAGELVRRLEAAQRGAAERQDEERDKLSARLDGLASSQGLQGDRVTQVEAAVPDVRASIAALVSGLDAVREETSRFAERMALRAELVRGEAAERLERAQKELATELQDLREALGGQACALERRLDTEVAALRQLKTARQAEQWAQELTALKEALWTRMEAQSRAQAEVSARLQGAQERLQQEGATALTAQVEQAAVARSKLELELRRMLMEAEDRARKAADAAAKPGAEAQAALESLRNEDRSLREGLARAERLAELASEQSISATRQAAAAEASSTASLRELQRTPPGPSTLDAAALEELRAVSSGLAAGVVALARVCGLVSAKQPSDRPDFSFAKLLEDEKGHQPLVVRLGHSWATRTGGHCRGLFDLLAEKVDGQALKLVQRQLQDQDDLLAEIRNLLVRVVPDSPRLLAGPFGASAARKREASWSAKLAASRSPDGSAKLAASRSTTTFPEDSVQLLEESVTSRPGAPTPPPPLPAQAQPPPCPPPRADGPLQRRPLHPAPDWQPLPAESAENGAPSESAPGTLYRQWRTDEGTEPSC